MRIWRDEHPLCPHCYTNRKGRTNRKGHAAYVAPRKPRGIAPWEQREMRRPSQPVGSACGPPPSGDLFSLAPLTLCYLSDSTWEDGTERQLATVTFFVKDGRWRMTLNDRDLERVAYITGDTPEDCVLSLEEQLAGERVDWRRSEGGTWKKKR